MKEAFKTTLLLSILTGMFVAVGFLIGGRQAALFGLVMAGVMNFGIYWFSDKAVLKMHGAKPLDQAKYPAIYMIIRELASKANMPLPKMYIVDTPVPNAFATGRNEHHAAVAVTSGIFDILSEQELRGVLAHELSHVKNRDMLVSTIAVTLAGALSYIAQIAMFAGGRDEENRPNPIVTMLLVIISPIAASIVHLSISRSREYLADENGAHLQGTGTHLASALQKLEQFKPALKNRQPSQGELATQSLMFMNMFNTRSLAGLFSTHPSTADRLSRLAEIEKVL